MSLQIRRLSYALGAEISGVDISRALADKDFDAIQAAFLEHCILVFRGQALTREQHIAFSRRFGELDANNTAPRFRIPEYPEILLVAHMPGPDAKPNDKVLYQGDFWHSDRPFMINPPMASLLRAVEIPDVGGDTQFANLYLAYETLSEGMKKLISGLHAVHPGGFLRIDKSTPEREAETRRLNPPIAHPLVRVHPETGRNALYVMEKVQQLADMTPEESAPLIRYLCEHATRPQFVYRHRWQKDDLIMWDDRCTLHLAVNDYDRTKVRHMERTTVTGTPSGYVYEGSLQ